MKLLIDTCIVYDWLMGRIVDGKLVDQITTKGAYVSAVAVWEMAIKHALGKLPLPTTKLVETITEQGFVWLSVQPRHAETVLALPSHHRDPFDRMLVAQAQVEGLRIVSYDKMFERYGVDVWTLHHSSK